MGSEMCIRDSVISASTHHHTAHGLGILFQLLFSAKHPSSLPHLTPQQHCLTLLEGCRRKRNEQLPPSIYSPTQAPPHLPTSTSSNFDTNPHIFGTTFQRANPYRSILLKKDHARRSSAFHTPTFTPGRLAVGVSADPNERTNDPKEREEASS